jgi:hypothetical protein
LPAGFADSSEDGDELVTFMEQTRPFPGIAYPCFFEEFNPIQRFSRFFLDNRDFMYEISARFCPIRLAIIRAN